MNEWISWLLNMRKGGCNGLLNLSFLGIFHSSVLSERHEALLCHSDLKISMPCLHNYFPKFIEASSTQTCKQRVTYIKGGLFILVEPSARCCESWVCTGLHTFELKFMSVLSLERKYGFKSPESTLLLIDAELETVSQKVTWFPSPSSSLVVISLKTRTGVKFNTKGRAHVQWRESSLSWNDTNSHTWATRGHHAPPRF